MQEYLGFIDEIGRTVDGQYIYRLDFTYDSETIWGDYFNVVPTALVPNIQPDINSLSKQGKIILPCQMELAKKNYCFSMQDCIDGIIPLIFSEIDDEKIMINDHPFYLRFGLTFEETVAKLQEINVEMYDLEEVERGDDSPLDELLNDETDFDDEDEDDLNF